MTKSPKARTSEQARAANAARKTMGGLFTARMEPCPRCEVVASARDRRTPCPHAIQRGVRSTDRLSTE